MVGFGIKTERHFGLVASKFIVLHKLTHVVITFKNTLLLQCFGAEPLSGKNLVAS